MLPVGATKINQPTLPCGGGGRIEVQLHATLTSALNGGEWTVSHFWEKSPCYPLDRRYERYGKDKNLLSLLRIEPRLLGCLALSLVATPTELSRLLYHIE
jgi:hypothetical protein